MKALRPLRVLVLVQKGLIPPDEATADELLQAPWKMEYGIIRTLRSLGHTAIPLAVESDLGVIRKAMDEEKPRSPSTASRASTRSRPGTRTWSATSRC